jgi:hypothetical protein
MWCAETSPTSVAEPTDNPLAHDDVSDPSITIDRHVTGNSVGGADRSQLFDTL